MPQFSGKYIRAMAKSRDLLSFLQAFEAKLIEEKGEISPESDEAKLLEWAYNHAAQLNPILNNQRNELLNNSKAALMDQRKMILTNTRICFGN